LQQAGYQTAIIGKWGLGGPMTDGVPNNRGFDFFFGYNCQRQAHNLYPRHLWKNNGKVWLENDLVPPRTKLDPGQDPNVEASYAKFTQQDYAPEMMQAEALDFIRRNADQPFFLYYATPLTHVPLQIPNQFIEKYRIKFGEESPYIGDQGYFPNQYPHAAYAAMVSCLDAQVGEIVDQLKELGLYEKTIIMFTSDNGPTYVGGADSPYFDSAKPFSSEYGRGKGFTYEGGIRVPLIVSWPDKIAAGSTSNLISAFWDVFPTLAEVAGAEASMGLDGISFLPELLGRGDQEQHRFLYWEFPAYGGQQAVRMANWKAVRKDIFKDNMSIELYNLDDDPVENKNVAEEHPEIVKQIEQIMLQEHTEARINRFKIEQLGDRKLGEEQ